MNPMIMVYPAIRGILQQPRFKLVDFELCPLACGYSDSRPNLARDLSTRSTQFNDTSLLTAIGYQSRSCADVWVFGRVVSQCAAWMLYGFDGWRIPGDEETFYRRISGYDKAGNRTPRNGLQTCQSPRQLYRDFYNNLMLRAHNNNWASWTSCPASPDFIRAGSSSRSITRETISGRSWAFGCIHPQGLAKSAGQLSLAKSDGPRLTVEVISKWIRGLTDPNISSALRRQKLNEAKFDLKQILKALDERDHVFFVDDSASMAPHWKDVTATIAELETVFEIAQLVGKRLDLYFTSDPIIGYHREKTDGLVDILGTKPIGGVSTMRTSLEALIDRITTQNIRIGDNVASSFASTSLGRPSSIYILTDGIWQSPGLDSNDADLSGVENVINRLVGEVDGRNKSKDFVTLQFIRFGNSEAGRLRLSHLDDMFGVATSDTSKTQESSSITFGVTSNTGSVLEMLGLAGPIPIQRHD